MWIRIRDRWIRIRIRIRGALIRTSLVRNSHRPGYSIPIKPLFTCLRTETLVNISFDLNRRAETSDFKDSDQFPETKLSCWLINLPGSVAAF